MRCACCSARPCLSMPQMHRIARHGCAGSLAGCAFAAAYSIRYAGLFFIVALAILTARHGVAGHTARARGHATALAVSLVPVVIVISRNFALVGNWRGRDEMLVSNPLHAALNETAQAINALFLGSGTADTTPGGTFILKATFAVLVVSGLALLSWSAVRHRGAGLGSKLAIESASNGYRCFAAGRGLHRLHVLRGNDLFHLLWQRAEFRADRGATASCCSDGEWQLLCIAPRNRADFDESRCYCWRRACCPTPI